MEFSTTRTPSKIMTDPQIEADITAHYVDKWFHHEITDEELEERFKKFPLSTYEESPPIGVQ
jgi:hypothetical protein